jgi:hypothetical protein
VWLLGYEGPAHINRVLKAPTVRVAVLYRKILGYVFRPFHYVIFVHKANTAAPAIALWGVITQHDSAW